MKKWKKVLCVYAMVMAVAFLAIDCAQGIEITVPIEDEETSVVDNTLYTGIFGFRRRGSSSCASGNCAVQSTSFQVKAIPELVEIEEVPVKAADCACGDSCACGVASQSETVVMSERSRVVSRVATSGRIRGFLRRLFRR